MRVSLLATGLARAFTMISETMFLALFVAWYAPSGTGGLIKVIILDDLRSRKLPDLGSQRCVCFEPWIPVGIYNSLSEIGFLAPGCWTAAAAVTTAAAATTFDLDVLGSLAQSIEGRNTQEAG